MGSFAITTGTVFVKSCPEVDRIVEELRALADGMDERDVVCEPADVKKYGPGIVRVEINVYGYTSASTSTLVDEKVQEFGPYAVEAARFHTEWEGQSGCLYVGNEAQVAIAESADALDRIKEAAQMLQGDDIGDALHQVMLCAKLPSFKERYFRASGCACPFCGSKDIMSGPVEADGMIGWAGVECTKCGRAWQDVWTVIDITEIREADGREIQNDDREGGPGKQIRKEPSTEPKCPQCGTILECFPDQDGSCDWRCAKCGWSQHAPAERR